MFVSQIKAVDNGRPQKSSTTRLHIEWIPKPIPPTEPIYFEEEFFSFTVMESDPVAHMIGVIAVEPLGVPLWFDITGKDALRAFIIRNECIGSEILEDSLWLGLTILIRIWSVFSCRYLFFALQNICCIFGNDL